MVQNVGPSSLMVRLQYLQCLTSHLCRP